MQSDLRSTLHEDVKVQPKRCNRELRLLEMAGPWHCPRVETAGIRWSWAEKIAECGKGGITEGLVLLKLVGIHACHGESQMLNNELGVYHLHCGFHSRFSPVFVVVVMSICLPFVLVSCHRIMEIHNLFSDFVWAYL